MAHAGVFAVADDLSGAAEVAAVLMSPGRPASIALTGPPYGPAPPILVADLDSRHHPQAPHLVRQALAHTGDRRLFVKIDSLLRGDIASTAALCAEHAAGAPVVLAPALPSAGRTVVGGIPSVNGLPLRETRAWHTERRPAPASIAEALRGAVPSFPVPLAMVRTPGSLSRALARAAGRVAICDAETDADLDAIVSAAADAILIGAGGLAAALGRALPPAHIPAQAGRPALPSLPLLIVVGSAETTAAEQAEVLVAHAVTKVDLAGGDLDPGRAAHRVRQALATGPAVITLSGPAARGLGEIVVQALQGRPAHLVLTGGGTARRVLDALGVTELTPLTQVHHGAVHSSTPQGHSVVTRPGSFGDRDSLLRIATHLHPGHFTDERLT